MKFYAADKGFGFIVRDRGGKDIFVHASALNRAGISDLAEGQRVAVDMVEGGKGPGERSAFASSNMDLAATSHPHRQLRINVTMRLGCGSRRSVAFSPICATSLVHNPEPLRHHPHDCQRELRHLSYQRQEFRSIELKQFGVCAGNHRSAAPPLFFDDGHLSDDAAGPECLINRAAAHNPQNASLDLM